MQLHQARDQLPCFTAALVVVASLIYPPPGLGQATITPSGLGTAVTINGNAYTINGGTQAGTNLFHSFGEFSLLNGGSATFNRPETMPNVTNVFSRVTGGQPSTIDGRISTLAGERPMPNANFFLINPAGVMFGSAASIDVGGTFHASSSDRIIFQDGREFSNATSLSQVLLLTAPPQAFGFLGSTEPIRTDGTMGTVVDSDGGGTFLISGGTYKDTNLFHSFDAFSIPGGAAIFEGLPATQNVISRVTGGEQSVIDGFLSTRGGQSPMLTANFFFINPAGLMFGPGAFLDIGGSVYFSTANQVIFPDQIFWAAPQPNELRLFSSAMPQAFGFLPGNTGEIDVNGAQLFVDPDDGTGPRTLSLVGGPITVQGGGVLFAPGGLVQLVSVVSPGNVNIASADVSAPTLGLVRISDGSTVTAGGSEFGVPVPGGSVVIRSGQLVVETGALVASDTSDFGARPVGIDIQARESVVVDSAGSIRTSTGGVDDASRILIATGDLTLSGFGSVESRAPAPATGKAGAIDIQVGNASLVGGGTIKTLSDATGGGGGNITVAAPTGTVSLSGQLSEIVTGTNALSGSVLAGDISITAANVVLADRARIRSGGPGVQGGKKLAVKATDTVNIKGLAGIVTQGFSGDAGAIAISAGRLAMDAGFVHASTFGAGGAGTIDVKAGSVNLVNGAQIASSTALAASNQAGNITIEADSVAISGRGPATGSVGSATFTNDRSSGVFSTSSGTGKAGSITILTPSLTLADLAKISVATTGSGGAGTVFANLANANITGGARMDSSTSGSGAGGAIEVNGVLSISGTGSGLFSTASNVGDAGAIMITAPTLTLANGGRIAVTTTAAGDAGTVTANAGSFNISGGGRVDSSTTAAGAGGAITVNGALSINGAGSGLFSTAAGTGNAGTITVTGSGTTLAGGGRIDSSTTGGGAGGAVQINGNLGISGAGSGLFSTASSTSTGNAGAITVNGTTVTLADAARIAVTTAARGNAGTVTANVGSFNISSGGRVDSSTTAGGAGGAITVNGALSVSGAGSGLFSTASSTGHAGSITVTGPTVTLASGGAIDSSTSGGGTGGAIALNGTVSVTGAGSGLFSTASGTGSAGVINVTGPSLLVASGGTIDSSTTGAGAGGAINVNATNQVEISGGGSVKADSLGSGNTGSITIAAGDRILMEAGSISTRAATSDGGNIALMAPNVIRLTNSQITTSVESGKGGGGNIFIDPQLVLMQGSSVTANAFGGPGGNITLVANSFVADAATVVEASSALSTPGTVRIQSPDNNLAEAVAQLPKELVDASRLMQGACSARRAGAPSSFTVAGRGGIPADPDGYLPSYSASGSAGERRAAVGEGWALAMAGWDCWRQQ